MDEAYWEKPDEFIPDRFNDEELYHYFSSSLSLSLSPSIYISSLSLSLPISPSFPSLYLYFSLFSLSSDSLSVFLMRKRMMKNYFPFSMGARNCAGKKFAMLQGITLLATLMQYFDVCIFSLLFLYFGLCCCIFFLLLLLFGILIWRKM